MSDLTFAEFSKINRERAAVWHPGFPQVDTWSVADWSNAMCGEAGEAANVIKKIRRVETALYGRADPDIEVLIRNAGKEIADVYAYLDLLCTKVDALAKARGLPGLVIEDEIANKFNFISEREGLPQRIPGYWPEAEGL